MRIAICDDELISLENVTNHVKSINSDCEIMSFLNISELFNTIDDGTHVDAVLMDIEWHGKQQGIDYAAELYNLSPKTMIIFITGHPQQYSQRIFFKNVNLKGFISKPLNPTILQQYLQLIEDEIRTSNNRKLTLKFNSDTISIFHDDIFYVESHLNTVTIHVYGDSFRFYEKISKISELLPSGFFLTHKSFIVNMDKIKKIERSYVTLQTGKQIPISKHRLSDFREQYARYIGFKM